MKAMVLGAGVGSRLEPITTHRPKPLVHVANKPVMEHILALLKEHGITDIISNVHYLADHMVDHFGDGSEFGVNLKLVREHELSGDAGGVRACKDFFGNETFIVLMGDLLTDADLTQIISTHKKKGALATIALKQFDDPTQYGVVVTDANGFITEFQEKPKTVHEAKSDKVSTGIYVLEPEVFDHMPAQGFYGFGKDLFPKLVKQQLPVLGVEISEYWSDVGTIDSYKESNFAVLEKNLKVQIAGRETEFGWIGENALIHRSAKIEGTLLLGSNSYVGPNTIIRGHVIVGDHCHVGSHSEIENTIIWSHTVLEDNCLLRGQIVGFEDEEAESEDAAA